MSLVADYRRLSALCPALRLTVAAPGGPAGPGWTSAAVLARDTGARSRWLAAEAAGVRAAYGTEGREDVVASRALHRYLWAVGLLVSGPWYLRRRVPRLRAEDVWVGAAGVRLAVPPAFACLPGAARAGQTRAVVLDSEDDLLAELRATYADAVRPLLGVLRPILRRGTRALWGMAADDLVSGLWHLGRALGDEDRGAAMATRVLPAPLAPFPGAAGFRRLSGGPPEADHLTRTRICCCLHYVLRADEACATCPRRQVSTPSPALPAGLALPDS